MFMFNQRGDLRGEFQARWKWKMVNVLSRRGHWLGRSSGFPQISQLRLHERKHEVVGKKSMYFKQLI